MGLDGLKKPDPPHSVCGFVVLLLLCVTACAMPSDILYQVSYVLSFVQYSTVQ
jgi:hypothetical protein